LNAHKIQEKIKDTHHIPNILPIPIPIPVSGRNSHGLSISVSPLAFNSTQDAGASSESIGCPISTPHGNILLDFNNDSEEVNDSDVCVITPGNILVNFDSDRDRNVDFRGVECQEIESDADDEEDVDDDSDSADSSHNNSGSMTRKAGEKYTETDFDFLDEEWLLQLNESSEDNFSDTD
jgi:hypothetical protein